MGLIKAFKDSISGTFADQWKEIITAGNFDEHSAVVPGVLKTTNNERGGINNGSDGIISNGSKIYVPENTAAFIFSQSGIEEVITEPGGYEYQNGQDSVFNGDGLVNSLFSQMKQRVGFGGISADNKRIAFVNLREIRDIKFGTHGAQVYNDAFYGVDLEIFAHGSFSIQIKDAEKFIRDYVPADVSYYSFDNPSAKSQITSEFLQSFMVALNSLSSTYRISQLPSQTNAISERVANDSQNAGTWLSRFGFEIVKVAIENIEFTDDSREIVNRYSFEKLNWKVYDDVSQKASNISAQQKIAQGIENNGLGNMGGMIFGMNMAQGLNPQNAQQSTTISFDQQVENVKKLKELFDDGILTEEEFNQKKKEIMGL